MITREQIRAARAYLNWDREQLSQESGVSTPQIANFETGATESPRQSTLEALQKTFLRFGVGFKDGGVFPKWDVTYKFEGEGWYLNLLDDVYKTLIDKTDQTVVVLFSDESKSSSDVITRWKKIRNLGVKFKRVVREGDTHLTGILEEYRYMPAQFFQNNVIIVYANKTAVCAAHNTMAIVIDDDVLANTFRLQTDFYFETLKKPEKSSANERI